MTGLRRDAAPISQTVEDRILVRGRDLASELIGTLTFTEMFLLDLRGEVPSASHVRLVDAVLVAVMEHGITPSTLAARLALDAAPESMQGAMAAGLLANGSRFLGVVEEVAAGLAQVVAAVGDGGLAAAADRHVESVRALGGRVPGFGHNLHRAEDPRVARLVAIAREEGAFGPHLEALHELGRCLDARGGPPLIMNAAGVIGALLADLGYPPAVIRGFGLVGRSAGLVAHLVDEGENPVARGVWQGAHLGTPGNRS